MAKYRIQPAYEPQGEGNGWENCTDEQATCFYVEQCHGPDYWETVEGLESRAEAEAWIASAQEYFGDE